MRLNPTAVKVPRAKGRFICASEPKSNKRGISSPRHHVSDANANETGGTLDDTVTKTGGNKEIMMAEPLADTGSVESEKTRVLEKDIQYLEALLEPLDTVLASLGGCIARFDPSALENEGAGQGVIVPHGHHPRLAHIFISFRELVCQAERLAGQLDDLMK